MQAIEVSRFGGPDVLTVRNLADPAPGPGSVLIDVSVVDTLFLDTQIRSGWGQQYWPIRPPYVPGGGVAGVVAAAGDGVDPGWVGRRVVARLGESGAYTERAVAPEAALLPVPDGIDLPTAAALIHDGITAFRLRDAAAFPAGGWVLITAAAGGLGLLLVQLARAAGAKVVGAAGGPAKLDVVERLGADLAVDYTRGDWTERVDAAAGSQLRLVLDGAGGALGAAAFGLLGNGGTFLGYGAPSGGFAQVDPALAARRGIEAVSLLQIEIVEAEKVRYGKAALAAAAAGELRPWIGLTLPLTRAAEAHAAIEGRRVVGKTLLTVG